MADLTAPAPSTTGASWFGKSLELLGRRLRRWPEVGLSGDSGTLETYWRTTAPAEEGLRFALATTRAADGALVGLDIDAAPAPLWLPPDRWTPGATVRLDMPVPRLGGIRALGVAVLDRDGQRLPIRVDAEDTPLCEDGTIAPAVDLSPQP